MWDEPWRNRPIVWAGGQVAQIQDRLTEKGWILMEVLYITQESTIYVQVRRSTDDPEAVGSVAVLRPTRSSIPTTT